MFDSGISAKSLIAELKNEVDVAIPISNHSYILWLNSLEQLLYSEYIQEQKQLTVDYYTDNMIKVLDLVPSAGESSIRFEDIHTIYVGETQLIKSTLTSGVIFPDTYYKKENNIGLSIVSPGKLRIVYFVRPELKTVDKSDNISNGNVMVPIEFVELVKAKLRGEAYKVANEDSLAAKWINDYNILLETFKAWTANKKSEFGL